MPHPSLKEGVIHLDPGSFRDPSGGIFIHGDRVYRYFTQRGASDFRAVAESGLLDELAKSGAVVTTHSVSEEEFATLGRAVPNISLVVEHPRLPFISYVYEWSFEMLKVAALLYLRVLRAALERGFVLKDATTYNIQFVGPEPVFIDIGSFEPYEEGMPWAAYAQFCRMFLNPLLLQSMTGVSFHAWMRSSLEGIAPGDLSRVLSLRSKLRRTVLVNVVLQAWLNRRFARASHASHMVSTHRINKKDVLRLVERLDKAVRGLKRRRSDSPWSKYERESSYSPEAQKKKEEFLERAIMYEKPNVVWDLGCNTGRYSIIASRHAGNVLAFDSDTEVIDILYQKVRSDHPNILPLAVDLLNPSPDQGWSQGERLGLSNRGPADFVLCLALLHHLVIAGNVPMSHFIRWLASISKSGVIEFVPKSDVMAQELLRWRKDVYDGYGSAEFEAALAEHFRIIRQQTLPDSDRILYHFSR